LVEFRYETHGLSVDELIKKLREEKQTKKQRQFRAIQEMRRIKEEKERKLREQQEEIKRKKQEFMAKRKIEERKVSVKPILPEKPEFIQEFFMKTTDDWKIEGRITPYKVIVLSHPSKGSFFIPEIEIKEIAKDMFYLKKYKLIPTYAYPSIYRIAKDLAKIM